MNEYIVAQAIHALGNPTYDTFRYRLVQASCLIELLGLSGGQLDKEIKEVSIYLIQDHIRRNVKFHLKTIEEELCSQSKK